ncbi:uncharacterized protein LOC111243547 [Varroa destructor]|uniref:Uncharacterized protein n=1 Tax=Varroa destructor TaxID=109461 RepID=A0A7M7J0S6_VARDE|nr:uncharacterized protein LOC111243547 [Varroa destructor]XP_022645036.1 uncharacterized protein LOC111243547 [Varroa destructor]XP_022645038.1 uncharacterized protein LOC111243547 [Varroa destructor]
MRKSTRHRYVEVGKRGQRHMMLVMEDAPRRVKIKKRPSNQWKDNPSIVVEESSDQDEQGGIGTSKREGGDYLYEDKNRDDGDQVSDHEGDDASDKSQSESEEKDKDEIGKDKHDEERFYSKTFLELATKSALKKSDVGLTKDNDDGKYAAELDASGLLSLEEHLLLMEGRLIEDISNIVREELAEFKRLFLVSPSESPEPEEASSEDFADMFKTFAKFGDSKGAGDLMSLSNSDRWWKQARVIDGRRLTTTDTGIYFRKIAKTKRTLTFREYQQFVEGVAKSKKIPVEEIRFKLCNCGPPSFGGRPPIQGSTGVKPDRSTGGYRRFDGNK